MKTPDNTEIKEIENAATDVAKLIMGVILWITCAVFMFRYALGKTLEFLGVFPFLGLLAVTFVILAYLAVWISRIIRRLLSKRAAEED